MNHETLFYFFISSLFFVPSWVLCFREIYLDIVRFRYFNCWVERSFTALVFAFTAGFIYCISYLSVIIYGLIN